MIRLISGLVLMLACAVALAQQNVRLIEQQVDAYNSNDADKYASYFHDDIEVYNYPDTPITAGKGALIETTRKTFADHSPSSRIVKVIDLNDKVITLERASFKVKDTRQELDVIKIYQFQGGLIRRMTFMN